MDSNDLGPGLPDCGDAIDPNVFEQILEMDDDDEQEFSKGVVFGFFEQAEFTFTEIQAAMARNQLTEHPSNKKDLEELASKGHFLKGSSATLGLNKVRDSCEKMQHLGSGTDETGHQDIEDKNDSVERIKQVFAALKVEVKDAEKRLKKFYKM